MRISIIGLGYVGAVSAGCLARDGHHTIGCDIDDAKLELIRSGKSPIIEEGMQELIAQAVQSGLLEVTNDIEYAVHNSDVSFVCVGTPAMKNGGQDLSAITRVSEQLGEAIGRKPGFHLCVVRSTVLPGTVKEVIKPLLETHSGKRADTDFGIGFQPEFLREGSSIRDYDNPPYTILGADSEQCVEMVRQVFGHLPGEFIATGIGTAEMLKYCNNVFHALKITFANEIGRVSQALDVDPHEVMDLVCKDTQLNISPAYLKPGFAFGGSCLPKDVRGLLHAAKRQDVETPMLSGIMPSNSIHIQHAVDFVLGTNCRSVGMIGLSFKTGTDDLRESPLVILAERFIGRGLELAIHDPEVSLARLVGANRRYIEESIPHISSLLRPDLEEVIRGCDLVVVGLTGKNVSAALVENVRSDQIVLDLVNLPIRSGIRGQYRGVSW